MLITCYFKPLNSSALPTVDDTEIGAVATAEANAAVEKEMSKQTSTGKNKSTHVLMPW